MSKDAPYRVVTIDAPYDRDFQPAETDAHGWIQWKGTNVCIDLHCACGAQTHFDGDFFYGYECPACHRKYAVGQTVKLIELTAPEAARFGHEFYPPEPEEL